VFILYECQLGFSQTKYELGLAWDIRRLFHMSSGLDMSASLDFYQTKYEAWLGWHVSDIIERPSWQ